MAETPAQKEKIMENPFLTAWNDAVNEAVDGLEFDTPLGRHCARLESAGRRLATDYEKAIENLHREARLAVALRLKLEEVAGPEVASAVNG